MLPALFGSIEDERLRIRERAVQSLWSVRDSTPRAVTGIVVSKSAVPDVVKVGAHGYEHGWKYVGGPGLPTPQEHLRQLAEHIKAEAKSGGANGAAVNSRYDTASRDLKKAAKALDSGDHDLAFTHLDAAVDHMSKSKVRTPTGDALGAQLHSIHHTVTANAAHAGRLDSGDEPRVPLDRHHPDSLGFDDPYADISTQRLIAAARRITPTHERYGWVSTEGDLLWNKNTQTYQQHVVDRKVSPEPFIASENDAEATRNMLIEQLQHYGVSRSGVWGLFA